MENIIRIEMSLQNESCKDVCYLIGRGHVRVNLVVFVAYRKEEYTHVCRMGQEEISTLFIVKIDVCY